MPKTERDIPSVQCPACGARHVPAAGQLHNGVYAGSCLNCGFTFRFRAHLPTSSTVTLFINGVKYTVGNEYDPATSLNEYLRSTGISRGTKQMCIEGGCGVCLVTVSFYEPGSTTLQVYTVNSCLVQLYMCDGWSVTTIEGLGNPQTGLHPIQQRLAAYNGVQCGFCSPAQVMNMYGLLQKNPTPTMQEVEDAYDVTICRCTGYRPILDAMKSFASDASPLLSGGVIDIEDLNPKMCQKTGQKCSGHCHSKGDHTKKCANATFQPPGIKPLHIVGQTAQWFKPTTLSDLYLLLKQYGTSNYRLVFGNSGFGVYKEIGPWMYDILIDIRGVQELYNSNPIILGANLSLTKLQELFAGNGSLPTNPYFPEFANHLKGVSTTTVRNLASWAGNLMLKHAHPEFVSDIFTLLETVGTKLQIGDGDGSSNQYSIGDFLKLDMSGKVIEAALLPTFSDGNNYIRTYRTSQRLQNSHGYVTAGFNLKLDTSNNYMVLERPSLIFQGISASLNHAEVTEAFLVGKQLGDPQVLQDVFASLKVELVPSADPVLASPRYRQSLALAFFYRYVLDVCGDKVAQRFKSGSAPLLRPVSSGTQTYDTRTDEWPLNEPMPGMDAPYQVAGMTRFLDDIPLEQGELYAAFVVSSYGNARISSMDPSNALAMSGVHKFIQASDIPVGGKNNFAFYAGKTEEILSSGDVMYAGQPLAIIVADDPLTATTAASMVKVTYTDVQPPLLDIHEAIQKKSFFPDGPDPFVVGDPETAIAQSAQHVAGSVEVGEQYHYHMETQACRCVPSDDGGMLVQPSSQWIDQTAAGVATILNIPQNAVTVEVRRLGGAFGAKITRNFLVSGACALAAHVMQRPVRMCLDMHTNMQAIGRRVAYVANYEVGFTEEGILNGIVIDIYGDMGWNNSDSGAGGMQDRIDNVYCCENWKITSTDVKTNKPAMTSCRSPGSLPAQFMMEYMIEHVAKVLNKDPTEIRRANFYQKGQKTIAGMVLNYCNIGDIVTQLVMSADLASRQQQVAEFNQANRWKKRAISLVPTRFGIGWGGGNYSIFIAIYHTDGTIAIDHGGIEMGQGLDTKTAQVCAYELGVPLSLIRIKKRSSTSNANTNITGGSIGSELNCMGVIQCCQILKSRMDPVRQKMTNPTWQEVVAQCFKEGIDLSAHAYTNPYQQYDFNYNVYAAAVTEVELDVLTGQSQISRVDMLYDCGESLSPELDIGQIEGGFMMGLGYHLTEKIKYSPDNGILLTDGTWEYKPPLPKNLPIDFQITLLKNAPNPLGVLRSKATGEPPLMMSSSAVFAIRQAVEAARAETGQYSFVPLSSPTLVENVQTACMLDPSYFTFGP